jgi:CheY-like chemotaxis protein
LEKFSAYQSLAFNKILISLLEEEGISISTPTAIDIQKILANISPEDQSFDRLKYKIAPVLCRNKEDQEKIYQIFDGFEEKFPPPLPPPIPVPPPPLTFYDKLVKFLKANKLPLIPLILGVIGILLWISRPTPVIKPVVNIEISDPRIINKPIKFKAFLTDTSQINNYSVDWSFEGNVVKNKWEIEKIFSLAKSYSVSVSLRNKENKIISSSKNFVEILCEEKPSLRISNAPSKQPNQELYFPIISNASKDSAKYKYQWFVDNKLTSTDKKLLISKRKFNVYRDIEVKINSNGTHCDTDSMSTHLRELPSIKSRIIADGKPLQLSDTINWKNLLLIILFLFIIPFLISIALFYLLRRKKPSVSPKPETNYGTEEPYSIEFIDQDFLINEEVGVNNFADKLRKRQLSEILKLNVRKTITTSLTSIGLPQFVFTQLSKPTEYVILFDKEHSDSHLTKLFGYLLKKMLKEQVNLTVYEYYKEPLFLSNEKLNLIRIPIERVATFHADSTLIIIGESKNFVYPIKKILKDWVTTKFRTWDTKILLTPFSINDWDIKERLISEGGFLVIPTDMNAQNNLDKVIFKQVDRQTDLQIPLAYPARFLNLQTIEGLKNYLDSQHLLDWVCSLAVYPYTDWNLTIAMGHAFEDNLKSKGQAIELVNYTNLLKLGRISWMHDSSWNEGLRVEMMQQLNDESEVLARKTLLQQLDIFKEKLNNNSLINREFEVHHELNSFLLEAYHKDSNSIKKEPIVEEMLDKFQVDEATEIYLNNGINTLLKSPKNQDESIKVRDYFEVSNESENHKRRNNNIWSFVASTIAFILLMMFSYNFLKKSDFANWEKTANSKLTFKFKSLANNSGNSYSGIIVIDSIQKEFTIKKDTSFVLKVPISDTSAYGKFQLQYAILLEGDFQNLDSFKLNKNGYTLSLENTPQIPVTIFYPANSQSLAESLESYFPGAYDIEKKQTIAVAQDFIVYYTDKKYESYANSCVSIINKNLNRNIGSMFINDTTKSIFPIVPIGIIVPKSKDDWPQAALPSSLTEIWHSKVNNFLLTFNVNKHIMYYSIQEKNNYGTYNIEEVFLKNGVFKIITKAKQGYKLFFVKNIKSDSYSFSVCGDFFKTKQEIYPLDELYCNDFYKMTYLHQYSSEPNRICLPLNTTAFNWDELFRSQKIMPNDGLIIEYTNSPLLPSIKLPNPKNSNQKIVKISKSALSPSNPFDRNYVKLIFNSNEPAKASPFENNNTKQEPPPRSLPQDNDYKQPIENIKEIDKVKENLNVLPKSDIADKKPTNPKKILWVDDHSENNTSLIEKFEKNNISIKLASSNAEALALIKNNKFDLVISDIKRDKEGDIAGLNLFYDIRKIQNKIPFVFYTSQVSVEENMKEAYYKLKVNLITSDASELERGVNNILFPKPAAKN